MGPKWILILNDSTGIIHKPSLVEYSLWEFPSVMLKKKKNQCLHKHSACQSLGTLPACPANDKE